MFLPVWIRLRNIPVNYYTKDTIQEIAECVGQVLEVELDEEKSQVQDYVRVRVLFNISNPLRNSKAVEIPSGEVIQVSFDYERIRKQCFQCQRLTHDKNKCSFKQSETIKATSLESKIQERQKGVIIQETEQLASKSTIPKPLSDAMKRTTISNQPGSSKINSEDGDEFPDDLQDLSIFTDFQIGSFEASSSGEMIQGKQLKNLKTSWSRKAKANKELPLKEKVSNLDSHKQGEKVFKRKAELTDLDSAKCLKRNVNTVVQGEPPVSQ